MATDGMADQEMADALRSYWPDIDEVGRDVLGGRLMDLLVDNPPWNPGQGDPCWWDPGDGNLVAVEYHDDSDRFDEVYVWFCDHRHSGCTVVGFSHLSPRTGGHQS